MKWIGLLAFMTFVALACFVVFKACVFCHRRFSKKADEEIRAAEC